MTHGDDNSHTHTHTRTRTRTHTHTHTRTHTHTQSLWFTFFFLLFSTRVTSASSSSTLPGTLTTMGLTLLLKPTLICMLFMASWSSSHFFTSSLSELSFKMADISERERGGRREREREKERERERGREGGRERQRWVRLLAFVCV